MYLKLHGQKVILQEQRRTNNFVLQCFIKTTLNIRKGRNKINKKRER